jgi:hypothetical protein
MTAEQKRLERLHILATLAAHGPLTGLEIVIRANDECVDGRFEDLPDLPKRGMGAKLNALSLRGLVQGKWDDATRQYEWSIDSFGRKLLAENGVSV